ncbi:uncharacterized protein LOC106672144 [Cimex lectularius]|uniref:Reverse transcriptase domain-containing protein n=1 Tax=Cimex lectularius TaxID=79782 RepID=A0A8I6S6L1_CIMLE|nr:uncharacterized protein LOC106672144 [Cimex lectularius]
MLNAGLDESQAGIKIFGEKINNLRYADDATLMVESEEDLKSLLLGKKRRGRHKTYHSFANKMGSRGSSDTIHVPGIPGFYSCHEIKRCLLLGRKAMANLNSMITIETSPC